MWKFLKTQTAMTPSSASPFETLEPRQMLAAFVVDSLSDISNGDFSAGGFTFREAIELANANDEADTITFAEGLSGGRFGGQTPLRITSDVSIEGPDTAVIDLGWLEIHDGAEFVAFNQLREGSVVDPSKSIAVSLSNISASKIQIYSGHDSEVALRHVTLNTIETFGSPGSRVLIEETRVADSSGTGISNGFHLVVRDSTISRHESTISGAGIRNWGGGNAGACHNRRQCHRQQYRCTRSRWRRGHLQRR